MTETTIPAAHPKAPPDDQPPATVPAPVGTSTTATRGPVHTPGGLPAVPLAVITGNTTIGALSAAVLVGGPVAASLAVAGAAAATGTVAARAAKAKKRRKAGGSLSGRSSGPAVARGRVSLAKTGARPTSGRSSGTGRTRSGAGRLGAGRSVASRSAAGRVPRPGTPGSGGTLRRPAPGLGKSSAAGAARSARSVSPATAKSRAGGLGSSLRRAPGAVRDRAGAVKALRKARQESAPTRAARRRQGAADRRSLADGRRAEKARQRARRSARKGAAGRSGILGRTADRARRMADVARLHSRHHRDRRANARLARVRRGRRVAACRWRMRRLLVWSALRYWGRRLAAAAVAAPVGVLGIPSTWLGRKLGWSWLMYPGRRLFWRLSNTAHAARLARDAAIRQAFDAEAEQAEQDSEHDNARPVAATVPRAPRHHNARTATTGDGMSDTTTGGPGFLFHEAAAEMEAAAQSYDPDGMMHVLATCEGMPYAVQSFANTFRVLAERSDDEFPLEKEVGAALNEVYALLMQAVDAAAEVVTVFRNVHDQDIARHEDPRNNAEDKWDTTNN